MRHLSYILGALFSTVVALPPATSLALEVGDKAPLFSVPSTRGEIALADYAGRKHVVLALYFAVFTPV